VLSVRVRDLVMECDAVGAAEAAEDLGAEEALLVALALALALLVVALSAGRRRRLRRYFKNE